MGLTVSGCVVQFNLGVPGAPLISTGTSTPVPIVTILPTLAPTPTPTPMPATSSPVQGTGTDLGVTSSGAPGKAPPDTAARPILANDIVPLAASSGSPAAPDNTTMATALSMNTTQPSGNNTTANATHGVKLTPPDKNLVWGAPQFWQIENNGTATHTFMINATPAGAAQIMPARLTLKPGEARYFTVFPQGRANNTTITAVSTTDPDVMDSVVISNNSTS